MGSRHVGGIWEKMDREEKGRNKKKGQRKWRNDGGPVFK